jgi:hypothetical protein
VCVCVCVCVSVLPCGVPGGGAPNGKFCTKQTECLTQTCVIIIIIIIYILLTDLSTCLQLCDCSTQTCNQLPNTKPPGVQNPTQSPMHWVSGPLSLGVKVVRTWSWLLPVQCRWCSATAMFAVTACKATALSFTLTVYQICVKAPSSASSRVMSLINRPLPPPPHLKSPVTLFDIPCAANFELPNVSAALWY